MTRMITDFGAAVLMEDSHLSRWIVEHRRVDIAADYLKLFAEYIPKGGTVMDIGACLGDHTVTFSKMVGERGKVWAFEPNPDAFHCLLHNTMPYRNIRISNAAIGRQPGFGVLQPKASEPQNVGAFSVIPEPGGPIPIRELDHFTVQLERLNFLKIDVEGAELEVIAGGLGTILRLRPVILIELNRKQLAKFGALPEDVRESLTCRGYKVTPSEPHHSFDMEQLDALCVPV